MNMSDMKYNPEGSALRRDQIELLRLLQVASRIFEDNGIKWWLSSGTLLGGSQASWLHSLGR